MFNLFNSTINLYSPSNDKIGAKVINFTKVFLWVSNGAKMASCLYEYLKSLKASALNIMVPGEWGGGGGVLVITPHPPRPE